MHELSLAMSLVKQLEELKKQNHAKRILSVRVVMGKLAGVEKEAFEFCFPLACEGTEVDGARLDIQEVPVSVKCESCGKISEANPFDLSCAACKSFKVQICGGKEFLIESMEIE